MITFKLQTPEATLKITTIRSGETKLGQVVRHSATIAQLEQSEARFVLFGIAEDIGVQANYGQAGTAQAWTAFLKAIVNVQDTTFTQSNQILLLGAFEVDALPPQTTPENMGSYVEQIDTEVSQLVQRIVACDKIPIGIGGGHNNAYGHIKGTSQALGSPINVLNIDAHTDLRTTDYRHSGNGFSYALKEELLNIYAIFGLHQNYTPQYILDDIAAQASKISAYFLENMPEYADQLTAFKQALRTVHGQAFGMELDCDAIAHFPASAQSPVGFELHTIRQLLIQAAAAQCAYLHICEAAPANDPKNQVGKALSYLITDFIRHYGNSRV